MGADDKPANEQLPLLAPGDDGGRAALTAALGDKRGPGRPAGSPNKRTEAVVEHMLSRYRSPLEAMAAAASMPTRDFIARIAEIYQEFGTLDKDGKILPFHLSFMQIMQIVQMQYNLWRELAPYLHQKQPVALEIEGSGAIPLAIFVDPELAKGMEHALADGALTIDARLIGESEQDQGVSDDEPTLLDAMESNE